MRSLKRIALGLLAAATIVGLTPNLARPMLAPVQAATPVQGLPSTAAATAPVPARPPLSANVQQLRSDLQQLVRGTSRGTTAMLVVSLDRGDTLFSVNPDMPVAPA